MNSTKVPPSFTTRKQALIFKALQFSLVDDVIHLIDEYSKQPVIMMIGTEKYEDSRQEIKGFDTSTNSWMDFTTLPITYIYGSNRKSVACDYYNIAITRIDNKSTQLMISCKHDNVGQEFYIYDIILNNICKLVVEDASPFLQGNSFPRYIANMTLLHDMTLLHGNTMILATVKDCTDYHQNSIVLGHVSNITDEHQIKFLKHQLPENVKPILGTGVIAICGRKLYVYSEPNHLTECDVFDLTRPGVPILGIPNIHLLSPAITILNDVLYIIGGGSDGITNCSAFDTRSRKNIPNISELNFGRYSALVSVVEDKIYVFGGFYEGTPIRSVECYDDRKNLWTIVNELPVHWDGNPLGGRTTVLYV